MAVLQQVDHPNIIKLYDFYEEPKMFYMARPFLRASARRALFFGVARGPTRAACRGCFPARRSRGRMHPRMPGGCLGGAGARSHQRVLRRRAPRGNVTADRDRMAIDRW